MRKLISCFILLIAATALAESNQYGSQWSQEGATLIPADDIVSVEFSGITSVNFSKTNFVNVTGNVITFGSISSVFGFGMYTSDHQIYIRMLPDRNILIDGRTNPRAYTLGVLRFEHSPEIPGTRAINIDVDTEGQPDTHAINVNFIAKGEPGDYFHIYDGHVDSAGSTGGEVGFYVCGTSGDGTLDAYCVDVYAGMGVIEQHAGIAGAADNVFTYYTTFTNITAFANSTSANATLFEHDGDYVYWCDAAQFDDIFVTLATYADNPGVKFSDTFEYTRGLGNYSSVTVADGTNGMRQNGNIIFSPETIPSWATDTVGGAANQYCIRARRNQANLSVVPIEKIMKVVSTTEYKWDENADLSVNSLTVTSFEKHHDVTAGEIVLGVTAPTTDTIGVARGYGFDADAEVIYFNVEVPGEWIGAADFTIKAKWAPSTAPADTETVKWNIQWRSVAAGEDIDAIAASTATATYTQSGTGTAGEEIETSITIPYNDATNPLVVGDTIFVQFNRDVTGDTYGGKGVVFDWDVVYDANTISTH